MNKIKKSRILIIRKLDFFTLILLLIPFSRMETFEKQDVARYMLEEWIHIDIRKDKTEHQYDGRIEFEIPPQNIVCVHEVEDGFPEMDKWLFE